MSGITVYLIALLVYVAETHGLSCPYKPSLCNQSSIQETHCAQAPKKCSGSIIKDVCGCCNECAKVRDEECGGPFHVFGRCDEALFLECVITDSAREVGKCRCKNVQTPADCPYGLELTASGCKTGKCKSLPVCQVFRYSKHVKSTIHRKEKCSEAPTVFCDRECGNCCQHSKTCPPNPHQVNNDALECNRNFIGDESMDE